MLTSLLLILFYPWGGLFWCCCCFSHSVLGQHQTAFTGSLSGGHRLLGGARLCYSGAFQASHVTADSSALLLSHPDGTASSTPLSSRFPSEMPAAPRVFVKQWRQDLCAPDDPSLMRSPHFITLSFYIPQASPRRIVFQNPIIMIS